MISVIITCFNYGKYLHGCIESVLSQTYKDIEIIVVDDGSTDDTELIVMPYLKHNLINYVRHHNQGQAYSKNVGISHARGDFIAFLDADDLWHPDKLQKQFTYFTNNKIGVVYSRCQYIDEDSNVINYKLSSKYLQPRKGIVTNWLIIDNFIPFSTAVIRKECFDRIGMFDESLAMGIDWDLWLRMSTHYEFDYCDEKYLYYRMGHSGQMSKNIEERQRCSDRIMKNFLGKNAHLVPDIIINQAMAYTYCNRGEYYRNIDRCKSTLFFLKALRFRFDRNACKGLIKNIFYR